MSKNIPAGVALRSGGADDERKTWTANDSGVRLSTGRPKANGTVRQEFLEKQSPKEIGPAVCLNDNIPIKNKESWRPSTTYMSALQPRLRGP